MTPSPSYSSPARRALLPGPRPGAPCLAADSALSSLARKQRARGAGAKEARREKRFGAERAGEGWGSGTSPRRRRTGPRRQSRWQTARGTSTSDQERSGHWALAEGVKVARSTGAVGEALEAKSQTHAAVGLGLVMGPTASVAEGTLRCAPPGLRWERRRPARRRGIRTIRVGEGL